MLGEAFRRGWRTKREADGYAGAIAADVNSPKSRTAATMQHYVDHIERVPVVVLVCLVRYSNR